MTNSNEATQKALESMKQKLEVPKMAELPPREKISFINERVIKIKETRAGYRLTLEQSPLRPLVQKLGPNWSCNCRFKNCKHIEAVLLFISNDDSLEF